MGLWKCSARKGDLTHWQRWDAAYILLLAVPLNLAFPLAVVIIYVGGAGLPGSKMWYGGSWFPNAGHGIVLYILKWIGVIVFTVGMLKATQLHRRIARRWRELRPPADLPKTYPENSAGA
eukprot:TRINITY_DN68040_c0_g1_i1.p1 TRINITY_DN68040_c0_g1~~TRINITY_DN68040_c0_g1_i1.p1  ORF type:complete len:120 (+),score=7.33 TRINITY_DN68040_c0_g1_i1:474-833(+)